MSDELADTDRKRASDFAGMRWDVERNTVTNARQALELHQSYWEWLTTGDRAARMHAYFMAYAFKGDVPNAQSIDEVLHFVRARGYSTDYNVYAAGERRLINEARTIFVSDDMAELALYNAGINIEVGSDDPLTIDDDRIPELSLSMLPEDTGLIIFEKPIAYPDYDLQISRQHGPGGLPWTALRAISWAVTTEVTAGPDQRAVPGVAIYLYTDLQREEEWKMAMSQEVASDLCLLDYSGWASGHEFEIGGWDTGPDEQGNREYFVVAPHVAMVRCLLASVWGLMGSYIEPWHGDRATKRRVARSGREVPEDGVVKILHLRKFLSNTEHRKDGDDTDSEGREWTHSWIVRGHWAWRHCSQANADPGQTERKRVYIDPYRKGNGPLILKEKVYAIDR